MSNRGTGIVTAGDLLEYRQVMLGLARAAEFALVHLEGRSDPVVEDCYNKLAEAVAAAAQADTKAFATILRRLRDEGPVAAKGDAA